MTVRFVDLFAGVGGFRLAFENAAQKAGSRVSCVLSSEIDKAAQETYRLNFGEVPAGDIREVLEPPQHDLLFAGFPCQPFSAAGKKRGFSDTRGTLFWEIERILKHSKPRAFVLENVRGLLTNDGGRTIEVILKHLSDLGYQTETLLLNASNYGVPQNRLRLFIVGAFGRQPDLGLQSSTGAADTHSFKKSAQSTLWDTSAPTVASILEKSPSDDFLCSPSFSKKVLRAVGGDFSKLHGVRLIDYRGGNSLHSWDLGVKGSCTKRERLFMTTLIQNRRRKIFGTHQDGKKLTLQEIETFWEGGDAQTVIGSLERKGYLKSHEGRYDPVCGNMSFEVFKFLDPASISITLTSSDCQRLGIAEEDRIRRVTVRECARLMGYPDSFSPHPQNAKAYRQFGNSVAVPVVQRICERMFETGLIQSAATHPQAAGL